LIICSKAHHAHRRWIAEVSNGGEIVHQKIHTRTHTHAGSMAVSHTFEHTTTLGIFAECCSDE